MTTAQRLACKRGADIVLAGALLILTAPLSIAAGISIVLECGHPVLFRQDRTGWRKRPFTLVKFRTMTNQPSGGLPALPDSQRLTRVGRHLRRLSIDELPQLWNVLRDEMSLVGPRPLLPQYDAYYSAVEDRRFDMRPGITGEAQLAGRNTVAWDARLAHDVSYVDNWSLGLDARLLVRTAASVLARRADVVLDPRSIMQDLDVERAAR